MTYGTPKRRAVIMPRRTPYEIAVVRIVIHESCLDWSMSASTIVILRDETS